MRYLVASLERTLSQLFDPAFLRVFLLGMLTTIVAVIVTFFLVILLKDEVPYLNFDWDWLNSLFEWVFGLVFFWLAGIFFPPISTIFVSIFLDDVVDAVEYRYYPERKAGKRLGMGHLTYLAVRLAVLIIVLNILVIPLYIAFFWMPLVPLLIFYLLNGYLLGWGYYEMVAVRHLGIREAGYHRGAIRGYVLLSGLLMTVLFTIPIVNLAAPILSVAIICHIFHLTLRARTAGGAAAPEFSADRVTPKTDIE